MARKVEKNKENGVTKAETREYTKTRTIVLMLSVRLSYMRKEKNPLNLVTEPLVASLTTGWLGRWGWKAQGVG